MKYGSNVRCRTVRKSFSLFSKCQKMSAFETCASFATWESDVLLYPWPEKSRVAVSRIFSRVSTGATLLQPAGTVNSSPFGGRRAAGAENGPEEHAAQEAADVGEERDPARPRADAREPEAELPHEPAEEKEHRRDLEHLQEEEDRHERQDAGAREEEEVRPQHAGDRPARTDHRDGRMRTRYRLRGTRRDAAEAIEEQEPSVA